MRAHRSKETRPKAPRLPTTNAHRRSHNVPLGCSRSLSNDNETRDTSPPNWSTRPKQLTHSPTSSYAQNRTRARARTSLTNASSTPIPTEPSTPRPTRHYTRAGPDHTATISELFPRNIRYTQSTTATTTTSNQPTPIPELMATAAQSPPNAQYDRQTYSSHHRSTAHQQCGPVRC